MNNISSSDTTQTSPLTGELGGRDSIIVVSGGMDSITMLYEYKDRIALGLSFNYGSKHNDKEIAFARMHCERLGIPHIVIPLDFMQRYFTSSLLIGGEDIPEGNYDDENMKSTVVPFRNGIMLAIAAGMAESRGLKHVMLANHSGDHAIYPDCRPEFVEAMSAAISNGTYPVNHNDEPSANISSEQPSHLTHNSLREGQGVTLLAPYTDITKADIARHGKALGIDYSETWSCYKGGDVHCGKCGTCTERKQALREAGIEDNTVYEK